VVFYHQNQPTFRYAKFITYKQNMIPVVEGLLDYPYNKQLLTLLYHLAEWHALAKLRLHTNHTLDQMDKSTRIIGQKLRSFRDWTQHAFIVRELPSEAAMRARRKQKRKDATHLPAAAKEKMQLPKSKGKSAQKLWFQILDKYTIPKPDKPTSATSLSSAPAKVKVLNLFTYKLHALGDYVQCIRLFGATDSYSTQIVTQSLT
jgi:hypothetical protein